MIEDDDVRFVEFGFGDYGAEEHAEKDESGIN